MRIENFLFVALTLSLGACSFKKDDVKQNEAAKATADVLTQHEKNQEIKKQSEVDGGKLTDRNVTVTFTEHPEPGYYRMRVTWPESVVAMTVQIGDAFETETLKQNFYETMVFEGHEYRIRLYSKNSDGIEVSRKEIITNAPKDFILKSETGLSANTDITVNRFYFYPGARIITYGYNLSIKAKKIFVFRDVTSDASRAFSSQTNIQTAPVNYIVQNPVQLKGSTISIVADQAQGTLKVGLIGLDGQNGRNGEELDQEQKFLRSLDPKLNGLNGKDGVVVKEPAPCMRADMDTPCERTKPVCQQAPTNGTDGRQGQAGTPGENGQDGGDSGSLFINISNATKFDVEVGQRAGNPGRGGNGGPGSPGGLAGKAGNNPGYPCPNAQDGQPGAQGTRGANGKTGAAGTIGTVKTGEIRTTVFAL